MHFNLVKRRTMKKRDDESVTSDHSGTSLYDT